jgi:hypothetical protein
MHWCYSRGCERFDMYVLLPVKDSGSECAVRSLVSDIDACCDAKPILPRKMSFLAVHEHNHAIEPNRAGSIC